jgi:hypothetical protein
MKNLLFLFFLLILFSCKKSDQDFIIRAGYACGWGSGEDSLVISSSEIKYVYYVPMESAQPKINESRATTKSEWDEIENAVDFKIFRKLDYNTCNICVDGCDEWISMKGDDINHQIRYNKGLKIDSIAKLQEIIDRIKAGFH